MENPNHARDEWNYDYLKGHDDLKRAVVLYEYARHNDELKSWIESLREKGVLTLEFASNLLHAKCDISQRISREADFLNIDELFFLVHCRSFPKTSFYAAMPLFPSGALSLASRFEGGAVNERTAYLCDLDASLWERLRPHYRGAAKLQQARMPHLFLIPWKEATNNEISAQFSRWLENNRPERFPEPKKKGANSGPSGGASAKLNQLAAFRFDKFGNTWEQAAKAGFKFYSSKQKWGDAINAARVRIEEMYKASKTV